MCLGENVIVPAFIAAEFAEHTPPPQLREVRGPWLEKAASHSPVSSEQRAPEEPVPAQHGAGMSPFMYLPLLLTVFLGEPRAMGDGSSAAPSLNLLPATTSPVQPGAC